MSSHLFVVDDSPNFVRLVKVVLEHKGFEVMPFSSGHEALKSLADPISPNPAAIVLDLNMPDIDGREFYRRAREVGFGEPVLILSAYGAEEARRELGAEAAVSKPFDPRELTSTLQSLLP
jgi:DNA-binding response OmpR family regulator